MPQLRIKKQTALTPQSASTAQTQFDCWPREDIAQPAPALLWRSDRTADLRGKGRGGGQSCISTTYNFYQLPIPSAEEFLSLQLAQK